METVDRRSELGPSAVAVPGNLAVWCDMHDRFGRLPFADVVDPALRLAGRGFVATPYLEGAIREAAEDLAQDPVAAALLMPGGRSLRAGDRLVQGDFAESLALIAREGAGALHGGALGGALVDRIATGDEAAGWLTLDDLGGYSPRERDVVRGAYRGWEIVGPPPPASSGVHIVQMLNLLEAYDVARLGFGTEAGVHLMAEVIRIGFEDRRAASGDPDFVDIPAERLMSKAAAREALGRLRDVGGAGPHPAHGPESADTTHVTVADAEGGRGLRDPHNQRHLRRALHGAGDRHHPQQLHDELRPASGSCPVGSAREACADLDGADDGPALRAGPLGPRPAGRASHLPVRASGHRQPHRPPHDPSGGHRGAADLDGGARDRGWRRPSATSPPPWSAAATRSASCRMSAEG